MIQGKRCRYYSFETSQTFNSSEAGPALLSGSRDVLVAILFGLTVLLTSEESTTFAAEVDALETSKAAGQRLDSMPWYNGETDSIRSITLIPEHKPSRPLDWEWKTQTNRPVRWGNSPFWRIAQYVVWAILAGFFAFLIFLVIRIMLQSNLDLKLAEDDDDAFLADPDRIELLPFKVKKDGPLDLMGEAKRLYEQGDYSQAIVYLYSYMLVRLDRSQLIRLAKGKTNRQYLRELRVRNDLSGMLEITMQTFEDVFFGHYPLDRQRFEKSWNRMDEFHNLVSQSTPSP